MKKIISINISPDKQVPIITGVAAEAIAEYLPNQQQVLAIVDNNVELWFRKYFPEIPYILLHADESKKTLQTIENLTIELLNKGADRQTFLLGVGGGFVTDITGFLAATYMRGISFGFIPTTLLAQVDASIGGKNGVNVDAYKNMLGTFTQPEFIICNTEVLSTLPPRVFNAGMAEIIKAALIADSTLFDFIEKHAEKLSQRDKNILDELIHRAINIKVEIVERDEKEQGERRKLNLGHTVGHAIERATKDIMHGEAVSIGLAYAAKFSQKQGWLNSADVSRICELLQQFHLPIDCLIPAAELQKILLKDKKKTGIILHYIALLSIGKAAEVAIDISDINMFKV